QGGGRRRTQGHPRLRGAPAGIHRLSQRPALVDRRRAVDYGGQWHPGEDLCLVRQRMGLRQSHGGAGAQGGSGWLNQRRSARYPASARDHPRGSPAPWPRQPESLMLALARLSPEVRQYLIVTGNYWAFTLTGGALRMLV